MVVKLKQLWISRKYLWADLNTNELVVWQWQPALDLRSTESQLSRGLSSVYTSCTVLRPHFKPPAVQTFQNAVEWEIDIFPLISIFYFYHSTDWSIWILCWKTYRGPECKNHFTQTCHVNDHRVKKDSFNFLTASPLRSHQIASRCRFLCGSMNRSLECSQR